MRNSFFRENLPERRSSGRKEALQAWRNVHAVMRRGDRVTTRCEWWQRAEHRVWSPSLLFRLAFTPTTVFKPSLNHGKRNLTVSLLEVTFEARLSADSCCESSKSPKYPRPRQENCWKERKRKVLSYEGSLLVCTTSNQLFNNVLHEKGNRMKLMCV